VVGLKCCALEPIAAGIAAAAAAPRKRQRQSGWDTDPAAVEDLEFSVTLEKDSVEDSENELAVDVDTDTMTIESVTNGLVSKWNADNPQMCVKVRDCIVGVNGIRGNSDALLAEL